jgi:DNA-binding LacI/PurR family transcriptional regulator
MGRAAVRLLLNLLDGDGYPRQMYLGCTQVAGDSVAEPRTWQTS